MSNQTIVYSLNVTGGDMRLHACRLPGPRNGHPTNGTPCAADPKGADRHV